MFEQGYEPLIVPLFVQGNLSEEILSEYGGILALYGDLL